MRELPADMVLPEGMVPDEPPATPVVPKDAATVVLIRDTEARPEVFLQRRVTGMAFAGGMTVFPGGGVDRRDADTSVSWTGPDPAWWGRCFDCDPALATALVCAAVRETFEESGVLLAGPDATSVVADTRPYADARRALEKREVSLAQFLSEAGLVLRADLLRPWAHWVTPIEEPRRYDTRFFVAVLPEGQRADDVTSEASDALWQTPAAAIADWREGRRGLMPPTWAALADLDEFDSTAAVMAADRTVEKIIPRVVRRGGELHVVLPGDPEYPTAGTDNEVGRR